jgi:hypothetical protein
MAGMSNIREKMAALGTVVIPLEIGQSGTFVDAIGAIVALDPHIERAAYIFWGATESPERRRFFHISSCLGMRSAIINFRMLASTLPEYDFYWPYYVPIIQEDPIRMGFSVVAPYTRPDVAEILVQSNLWIYAEVILEFLGLSRPIRI